MKNKILKKCYLVLRFCIGIIIFAFMTYGFLTLWDMFRTEISAFASYDLLKYRPNIEEDEPPYLDELLEINPDTAGWITMYGTNIDYPVMQGKTDMEYLNKKATGGYSATGSIFMSVLNKKDFSDKYTLLYGHHMSNGSMFGDIDKFKKKVFFYNYKHCRYKTDEGILIMQEKVYNLHVLAVLETNAYDSMIYNVNQNQKDFPKFLEYVKSHAMYYNNKLGETDKVLALSTCDDERVTGGRSILVCQMKHRTKPIPPRETEPLTPHRKAIGHPMAKAYWGLLNLVVLFFTVYGFLPLNVLFNDWSVKRKKVKKQKAKKSGDEFDEVIDAFFDNEVKESASNKSFFSFQNKKFCYVLMGFVVLLAVILFILTEDVHHPIQVADVYTIPQLVFLVIILMIRGKMEGISLKKIWRKTNAK